MDMLTLVITVNEGIWDEYRVNVTWYDDEDDGTRKGHHSHVTWHSRGDQETRREMAQAVLSALRA